MKKLSLFVASMMLIGLFGACSSDDNNPAPVPETPTDVPETPTEEPDTYTVPEVVVRNGVLEMDNNEVAASSQLQDFSVRMTKTLLQDPGNDNILISPISASFALSLALNGADGDTYREMAQVMGFSDTELDHINNLNYKLLKSLPQLDPKVAVAFANASIAREMLPIKQTFTNRLTSVYGAEMFTIGNNVNIAPVVNKWAEQATNGMIKDLLDDNEDSADMVFALLNATCFCGEWAFAFDKELSHKDIFHCENGDENLVEYMYNSTVGYYGKNSLFRAINMDFGDEDAKYHPYTMTFILPEEGRTLSQTLDWLGDNSMQKLDDLCSLVTNLQLQLPKFELENKFDLAETLQKMGMRIPFAMELADFSKIAGEDYSLFISKAVQGNKFGIDENGAVGASATFLGMTEGMNPENEIPQFHATRPFLFMVRERGSNAILFMGCVRNL